MSLAKHGNATDPQQYTYLTLGTLFWVTVMLIGNASNFWWHFFKDQRISHLWRDLAASLRFWLQHVIEVTRSAFKSRQWIIAGIWWSNALRRKNSLSLNQCRKSSTPKAQPSYSRTKITNWIFVAAKRNSFTIKISADIFARQRWFWNQRGLNQSRPVNQCASNWRNPRTQLVKSVQLRNTVEMDVLVLFMSVKNSSFARKWFQFLI